MEETDEKVAIEVKPLEFTVKDFHQMTFLLFFLDACYNYNTVLLPYSSTLIIMSSKALQYSIVELRRTT